MKTGKIKFYNATKGYGFIIDESTGSEIFEHAKGLSRNYTDPQTDDQVQFETEQGKKGLVAVNVSQA